MQDHKISLVICAYNEEKYIGKCLEAAIKNSDGKFFEIIVINNASTDRTKEIAEKYPGVRVVDEHKKGQVQARQRSYFEVTGDIVAYIDADTLMPENWVDILIQEFTKNPTLACLSGPYIYYDLPKWQKFAVSLYWQLFAYPTYLIVGYMAVGGNFAIRKDVLDKMNGFDTAILFYGEDTDIAQRASKFGKVKFKLNFFMYSSARRLAGEGISKIGLIYVMNFLSVVFIKKPVTKTYKDIR